MQNRNGRGCTAPMLPCHMEPVGRLRTFRSQVTLRTLSTLPMPHLCTGDCQFYLLCVILDIYRSPAYMYCGLQLVSLMRASMWNLNLYSKSYIFQSCIFWSYIFHPCIFGLAFSSTAFWSLKLDIIGPAFSGPTFSAPLPYLLAIYSFQFHNSLYIHNVLYIVSCFWPITSPF